MKHYRVVTTFIFLSLIIGNYSYCQTGLHNSPRLLGVGPNLVYLNLDGDTLSTIKFNTPIKHLINLDESQLSVQTNTASHLVAIVRHQLVLLESRTPDVEPKATNWFLLFNESKQLFLNYSGPTLFLEYTKSKTQAKPGRLWQPLEYTTDLENVPLKNFVFDIQNQLLLFSIPGSQSYVSVSFKTNDIKTSYIQNQNSVPEACCANWFYDAEKKQVVLFLKNGSKRNEYHAFAFKNGIPKADKKVGQSYYHTKDWYELGLYKGKFDILPEYIAGDNLFKNGKKIARLDSQSN